MQKHSARVLFGLDLRVETLRTVTPPALLTLSLGESGDGGTGVRVHVCVWLLLFPGTALEGVRHGDPALPLASRWGGPSHGRHAYRSGLDDTEGTTGGTVRPHRVVD